MTEVVRYELADGGSVLVEADEDDYGVALVRRREDGIIDAGRHLEEALASVRGTIVAAIGTLHGLGFEDLTLQFGVKLAGEAGAMIAKTSAEGHMTLTLRWAPPAGAG